MSPDNSDQMRKIEQSIEKAQLLTSRASEDYSYKIRKLEQSFDKTQRDLSSRVDKLATSLHQAITLSEDSRKELQVFHKQFVKFAQEDRLARNMEFAQTALIDARAQFDREFGHHKAVRQGAMGMLQAMDAGIVTYATIQQESERLMIAAPSYWLAPAQVALAAWIRNSRAHAERALLEAMNRDPSKTALFFSLVLARYERHAAAAQWIQEYARHQNSRSLSPEFIIVLDAITRGALGGRSRDLIKTLCVSWYEQLSQSTDLVERQQANWQAHIGQRRKLTAEFRTLPHVCVNWPDIWQWLEGSTVYNETEGSFRTLFEAESVHHDDLRSSVDDILRNLITAYDENEAPLLRQMSRWQAIIEKGGDHAAALSDRPDESRTKDQGTDFLTFLSNVGLRPHEAGTSAMTAQLAVMLASDWIEAATSELVAESSSECPEFINVQISGWRREIRADDSEDRVVHEFCHFIDQQVAGEINKVNVRRPRGVLLGIAGLTAVSALVPRINILRWPFSLIPFLVFAVLLLTALIALRRANKSIPRKQDNVRTAGEARKEIGATTIRCAVREVRQVFDIWNSGIAASESLVKFVKNEVSKTTGLSVLAVDAPTYAALEEKVIRDAAELSQGRLVERDSNEIAGQSEPEQFAIRLPEWDLVPPASRL